MKFVEHCAVLVIAVVAAWPSVRGQPDYCLKSLCDDDVTHVACTSNKGFQSGCPDGAKQVPMDASLRALILERHNRNRCQVAKGNLTYFPTAAGMAAMIWDNDMEYVSGFNARSCKMEHDLCRATHNYPISGQNLAMRASTGGYQDIRSSLIAMIDSQWFGEHKDCPVDLVRKFRRTSGPQIGHFTAMIQQKCDRVGCTLVQFKSGKWYRTLLACNYSYTNMLDEEIYRVGAIGSLCKRGMSARYPALCANN